MSRFSRVIRTCALAGLLGSCATPSGVGGPALGDAVSLSFAWPEGFTVQVVATGTVSQAPQPPERSELSYQLRLEGKGEERRLLTEPWTPAGGGAPAQEGHLPPTPAIVLGPKGELRRIEGIDEVVSEMAREAESQGLPAEQQAQIMGLVRDALEQASRSRWEALVGKWSGLVLKPGEAVERRSQVTLPLFGSTASTLEHVSLKERVACAEGETEKRCVRLVLESSLDPAGMDQATQELLKKVRSFMKANMGLADVAIPEMTVMPPRLEGTLEFIAEPETLVPHRQRTVTNFHVTLQEAEGAGAPKTFDIQSEQLEIFKPVGR
jgi:hypothetical protein